MRAKECVIWCSCEQGFLFKTSLKSRDGNPAFFWLTEDEHIFIRGYCSKCGEVIEFKYSIVQMLFDCPRDREVL
jgi:hypothetical protein